MVIRKIFLLIDDLFDVAMVAFGVRNFSDPAERAF